MSQPLPPHQKRSFLLSLLGGLLLGLALGCVVALQAPGAGNTRSGAAGGGSGGGTIGVEASSVGGGSKLGRKAQLSAFAKKHEALLEQRKAMYAAQARQMSPEARRKLILELSSKAHWGYGLADPVERTDQQLRLQSTILREDVAGLLELMHDPKAPLTQEERGGLYTVYSVAVELGMTELIDRFADNPRLKQSLERSFMMKNLNDDPLALVRQFHAKEREDDMYGYAGAGYVFGRAAELDPELALREAKVIKAIDDRAQALQASYSVIAENEGLEKAWELSSKIPEDGIRSKAQITLLQNLIQAKGEELRPQLLELLTDPEMNPHTRDQVLPNLVQSWAETDPVTALKWAREYTDALPPDPNDWNRDQVFARAIQQYALLEPEAAFRYIQQLPEALRDKQLPNVLSSLAWKDVDAALRLQETLPPEQAAKTRRNLVGALVRESPERAVQYVERLGDVEDRPDLVGNLMSNWTRYDPIAATGWLAQQPADKARDRGISNMMHTLSRDDPESAAEWAMHSSTEDARRNNLRQGLSNWARSDPDAARNFVNSRAGQLEPKTVEQLLNTIGDKKTSELNVTSRPVFD